jgi:hypothetical protein
MQLNTYENYKLHIDTHKIFPLTNTTKVTLGGSGGNACMYIWWVYVRACLITTKMKHVASNIQTKPRT